MAVLSKLRELSLPYNCYEVGHTWDPECYTAALSVGACCLLEGMKIYAPLYLVSQILQRKFSLDAFINTIQSIRTSSCFLGVNGFAFIFIFCLFRKAMGKFYYLHCSYFPAFVASFLAILVERKNRKHGFTKDFVSAAFRFLFGKEEAKPKVKAVTSSSETQVGINRMPAPAVEFPLHDIMPNINTLLDEAGSSFFQRIWSKTKHVSCPHPSSCTQYCLQGFLRPFMIGYLAFSGIRCFSMGKKILMNPSLLFHLLTQRKTLNLGLFLGGFGGTFRFVNCLLRWLFEKDQAIYAIPAAFLGGLFMKFFPSSTLSLYLMWKLIENGYLIGMEDGFLPKIRGSMLMLYATSTAFLFYAAVLEPHNLKPAYLKFLTRLTHNKIGEINRHVLDIFGTHASKLYSDFWPELDLRHTSRVFQESVLLWLIH
ncbi:transmembrane protein 135 [Trichonephila clavipes]|nr:transmembrane protein 135 [Trichonephila clavipes]